MISSVVSGNASSPFPLLICLHLASLYHPFTLVPSPSLLFTFLSLSSPSAHRSYSLSFYHLHIFHPPVLTSCRQLSSFPSHLLSVLLRASITTYKQRIVFYCPFLALDFVSPRLRLTHLQYAVPCSRPSISSLCTQTPPTFLFSHHLNLLHQWSMLSASMYIQFIYIFSQIFVAFSAWCDFFMNS